MRVLMFCPAGESRNAEKILSTLRACVPDGSALEVDCLDDACAGLPSSLPEYQAVVILYTPALALSNCLFEWVHQMQQRPPVGRFLFLPQDEAGSPIPAIFHPIRRLQMNLYFYTPSAEPPQTLAAQMDAFRKDWERFFAASSGEERASRRTKSRRGGWGLLAGAVLILALLGGLIAWLLPKALPGLRERFAPIAILVKPPSPGPIWLEDSFQAMDPSIWKVQHMHTSRQPLQETISEDGLVLTASAEVESASLELTGVEAWPLDSLQRLAFTFDLTPLDDPSAKGVIQVGLRLMDDPAYMVDCLIVPGVSEGQIQCKVQSPAQLEALANPVSLTPGTRYTVELVFDPQNYSVQAFLDSRYLGSREIQSVEFWRGRTVQPVLLARLEHLQTGAFQCRWYEITITHQPGTE